MNKKNFKLLLSFFLVLFTFSLPVFSDEAIVTYVKGKVEFKSGENWVPVEVGQKIPERSLISTGFQSQTRIQYKGTVLALGPLTRITLEKLAETDTKEIVNVYLNTGAVRSKVTHPESKRVSQSVRNAVTVCSVRGTNYLLFDNGRVICSEGAVATYPVDLVSSDFFANMDSNNDDNEEIEYDSATATTEASDIANFAPRNAVVVAAGQEVTVLQNGEIQKPYANAIEYVGKIIAQCISPAESEKLSFSSVSHSGNANPRPRNNTGSIIVDVTFPQE